jgi:hypothetical protein
MELALRVCVCVCVCVCTPSQSVKVKGDEMELAPRTLLIYAVSPYLPAPCLSLSSRRPSVRQSVSVRLPVCQTLSGRLRGSVGEGEGR